MRIATFVSSHVVCRMTMNYINRWPRLERRLSSRSVSCSNRARARSPRRLPSRLPNAGWLNHRRWIPLMQPTKNSFSPTRQSSVACSRSKRSSKRINSSDASNPSWLRSRRSAIAAATTTTLWIPITPSRMASKALAIVATKATMTMMMKKMATIPTGMGRPGALPLEMRKLLYPIA